MGFHIQILLITFRNLVTSMEVTIISSPYNTHLIQFKVADDRITTNIISTGKVEKSLSLVSLWQLVQFVIQK